MKPTYSLVIAALVILIGFVIIVIGLSSQLLTELKVAIGLFGLGQIITGYVIFAQNKDREQEKKQVAEKFEQLIEKLEKIEKLGEKLEQPKNTGIAIADGLLKLYTDYLSNPKEDKKDD